MAKKLTPYTWYFIVLSVCIGRGNGSWKRQDRDNLQHDIDLFEKLSDKIEREIAAFYEEYSDDADENNINKTPHKYVKKVDHNEILLGKHHGDKTVKEDSFIRSTNITNDFPKGVKVYVTESISDDTENEHVSFIKNTNETNYGASQVAQWPKFDDLLLAMGKRYDWKNDRWIKVKDKFKGSVKKDAESDSAEDFHSKHKFSYRTVKLKSSKSRRNVVIAVSAVR